MQIERAVSQDPSAPAKVMVVDDSRLVRAVVTRYLRASDYQVDEAENGAQALRMLAQADYDVVITDLRMPELDGFEVLASVRRIAPMVEVIILTGAQAQESAIRALRLGAHDYLTKPPANADAVLFPVRRAVEKKRLHEANLRLLRELEGLSRTDALTGIPNRRSFDEDYSREVARARRHEHDLAVVMLDIDHFKKINDSFGHQGGDEVLRAFAACAAGTLRESDVLYRYGGEEFTAILPYAEAAAAMGVAKRIVAAVAANPVRVGGSLVSVTTSAGVGSLSASGDAVDLLAEADAALYDAKRNGRNQARTRGGLLALVAGGRLG